MALIEAAIAYHRAGLCVLPACGHDNRAAVRIGAMIHQLVQKESVMDGLLPHFIPVRAAQGRDMMLLCPVCGDDFVHPIGLECISPGSAHGRVSVDHHGIHLDPTHPAYGRGVLILLRLACEQGHEFHYQFHFHKGNTMVQRILSSQAMEEEPTIWRD